MMIRGTNINQKINGLVIIKNVGIPIAQATVSKHPSGLLFLLRLFIVSSFLFVTVVLL